MGFNLRLAFVDSSPPINRCFSHPILREGKSTFVALSKHLIPRHGAEFKGVDFWEQK